MDKIKILDIASTDIGAYRLLRTRVKKINEDDRFINYIACPNGYWAEKIIECGLKHIPYEIDRKINFKNIFSEIGRLEALLLELKPDIVHSHNSKSGAIARLAVKNINKKYYKNIKMIHQVHGYHFTKYKGVKKTLFLKIEKYLAKNTHVLLFQNNYELELSKAIGIEKECVLKYIGNGINFEEFCKYTHNTKFQQNKKKKIVCVARIEPIKNHKMLIKSLGILKNKFDFNNFEAVIIGEGDNSNLVDYISMNNLEENIKFTGQLDREDVIGHISTSDVSVLTSIKEGRPRALIESLILGKPCVGTNVVGTNEVIVNGENGYLVELGDELIFAKSIYKLLTVEEIYNKFSNNATAGAYKEFNEDTVIQIIKEVYLSLLKNVSCIERDNHE